MSRPLGFSCVVLSIVTLLGAKAFGQQSTLPDATTVANRTNQRVLFQDVVKAASHSNSRDGCYINFGAPYPNQVLSVWVPDTITEKLPRLLGRTVRIDGVVQLSESGPLINLESPGQIEVLPVDESILSKMRLGGRTDRREFILAIKQRLKRGDIDTVEVLGNELHQSHERFTDGTWLADAYFAAFDLAARASEILRG